VTNKFHFLLALVAMAALSGCGGGNYSKSGSGFFGDPADPPLTAQGIGDPYVGGDGDDPTNVPEPGTALLMGTALLGLAGLRRLRRR
jgi:hypothetical protein